MTTPFAKMFDTEMGQIVVIAQDNVEGDPEVRFFFDYAALGVCTIHFTYSNTPEGRSIRDAKFHGVDDGDKAYHIVSVILEKIEESQRNPPTKH